MLNFFFVIRDTFTLGTPLLSLCGKVDITCCPEVLVLPVTNGLHFDILLTTDTPTFLWWRRYSLWILNVHMHNLDLVIQK